MRNVITPDANGEICAGPVAGCPLDKTITVQTDRFRVAVFHTAQGWIAIKDHCPHADLPLARGTRNGLTLTCPGHNWQFDLSTMQCTHGGPPDCTLRSFPVDIRDNTIFVKVRA